jgi:hypothetical protein
MWNSQLAQAQQERRKRRNKSQIQKGGLVYAGDVNRDISNLDEIGARWEADLHPDQKVHMLIIRTYVLPQLLLKTKERKQVANRDATNTTRRVNRKRKRAEVEEGTEEDGQ